jgi:hypothetical protein
MDEPRPADPTAPLPFAARLARLRSGLTELAEVPSASLSEGELREAVAGSFELIAQVEAVHLRLVAELDDRPSAVEKARPGSIARTFLRHALHRSAGQAAADVRAAHAITVDADHGGLPELGAALTDGRVSRAHLDAGVRVLERIPRQVREHRDEQGVSGTMKVDASLAEWAPKVSAMDTARLGEQLAAHLDPNGADGFDARAHECRSFALYPAPGGGFVPGGFLPPLAGGLLGQALDVFGAPSPASVGTLDADGRPVDAQGQPILPLPDTRTRGQRHADALEAIARIALGSPEAGTKGGEPPRIVVHTTPGQLAAAKAIGSGADGVAQGEAVAEALAMASAEHLGLVGPQLLARLSCDAVLQRVLLAPSGAVLDLGREQRTVTAAQRRALVARDGGCVVAGCTAPPGWTDAHHVTWWSGGGCSDLASYALVCARHYTEIHLGMWDLVMIDGVP